MTIQKVMYHCTKCQNIEDNIYNFPIQVASFENLNPAGNLLETNHTAHQVIKTFSKLILWSPGRELREKSYSDLSKLHLDFNSQYESYKNLKKLISPEFIPPLIAILSSNNVSNKEERWKPKIEIVSMLYLPFTYWLTEHYEFITCSGLKTYEKSENMYLDPFDKLTWALIGLSIFMAAIVVRGHFSLIKSHQEVNKKVIRLKYY